MLRMSLYVSSSGYFSLVLFDKIRIVANPATYFKIGLFDLVFFAVTSNREGFTEYHLQYKNFELFGLFYGHQESYGFCYLKVMHFMENINE